MDRHPWLSRFDGALKCQGLPSKKRARYVAELSDHLEDLMEENSMSEIMLENRLGRPETLAAAAVDVERQASWTTRHPFLVFALAPVPFIFAVMIAAILIPELLATIVALFLGVSHLDPPRRLIIGVIETTNFALRFGMFAVATWVFTRLYVRAKVSPRWYTLAMAQICFLAFTFFSKIEYSDIPGQSRWMTGFTWLTPAQFLGSVLQVSHVIQLALPAALAFFLLRNGTKRSQPNVV